MGVMLGSLMVAFALIPAPLSGVQTPAEAPARQAQPDVRISPVQYDENGWPIVPDQPARPRLGPAGSGSRTHLPPDRSGEPMPASDHTPSAAFADAGNARDDAGVRGSRHDTGPIASGMELGSPLLDIFQFTRSPAAFKALAGQTVWWRVTVHGSEGETIGIRELTHTADCTYIERDRLQYDSDGRVYGRYGASLYAERQSMPWPSDAERGGHELAVFGTQLRMPFCFGDGITYGVLQAGTVNRGGERLRRVLLERRPLQGSGLMGPELDPRPRDQFEIIYEPGTGRPRELVHRFAQSQGARRVVFEDWREFQGVRIPYKRVYVDETLKRTTTLEILDISPQQVTERTFRLHG